MPPEQEDPEEGRISSSAQHVTYSCNTYGTGRVRVGAAPEVWQVWGKQEAPRARDQNRWETEERQEILLVEREGCGGGGGGGGGAGQASLAEQQRRSGEGVAMAWLGWAAGRQTSTRQRRLGSQQQ